MHMHSLYDTCILISVVHYAHLSPLWMGHMIFLAKRINKILLRMN